eukprot:2088629-Pyramimonas_sp.AAC.1
MAQAASQGGPKRPKRRAKWPDGAPPHRQRPPRNCPEAWGRALDANKRPQNASPVNVALLLGI